MTNSMTMTGGGAGNSVREVVKALVGDGGYLGRLGGERRERTKARWKKADL